MNTEQRRALVVGASGGIGRAVSQALAAAGLRVGLVGRDRDKLAAAQAAALASLGDSSGGADAMPIFLCDLTDRGAVGAMVDQAVARLGGLDVLVCAAGINIRQRSLRSLEPADWDRVIASNLTAAFNVIHFVVQTMRSQGGGLVIQLSSLAGIRASTVAGAAYSAAKFGQGALGLVLGREERGRNIRSTVLYPGEVDTPFLDVRAARPGGGEGCAPRREGILQPADVARVVRFLVELPAHVHIPELVIKPTIDDFA